MLRIADALRIPRVVLVGDEKQLDAVDAGKPFAQLQAAGMNTAVMDQIMRQRDPALKEAVEASLAGDVARAFEKLGERVAEVKPDNLAGAAAARWLALPPEERERTGLMAPSNALRQGVNEIIRARLARDGTVHGPRDARRAARLAGLHPCAEGARAELPAGRRGGLPPPLQAPRGRAGRGASRVLSVDRAGGTVTLAGGGRAHRRLGARADRRARGRGRGLQARADRASRGRPHSLDPQRRRARARQQHSTAEVTASEGTGGSVSGSRTGAPST